MSKISREGYEQIQVIKNALDSMFDKLDRVVYIPKGKAPKNIDGSYDCDLLGVPLASLCVLFRVELGPLDDRTMRHMTCRECGGRGSERAQKEILGCILLTRHSTRRVCISRCY